MNPYQILELILEALADGRQEGESIKDFKKRKADELEKHFRDQAHLYRQGEAIAAQRAKEAKIRYEENPNSETGQQMVDSAINALDKAQKTTNVERKEYNARRIKNKMSNEALEIMEEILNVLDEDEIHDYKAVRRNAEKNMKDHAYKAKQFERRSDKAIEQGKERKAEVLYDKANDEWDQETAEQQRAAQAHNRVQQLRKKQPINCALDLMEQICDFADNLFELDYEEKQNISPNKISRTKKDKDGEKVEVVSVADELFPYSGNAKEQFNKKVLDKINDMIEGTGSLEDLIQFVRRGVGNKKVANEGFEEAVSLLETLFDTIRREHGKPHYEYDGTRFNTANKSADLFHKAEGAHNDELRKAENKEGWKKVSDKRNLTKNKVGEEKTRARSKQQIGKYNERLLKEIDSLISKNEGLDEAKDPKGYKENMDIANHYDHLYSKEPANSPDGSPNPVAAEYKRKYQEYFDKAMKCHYGDENKSKKVSEALEILEDIHDAIRKSNKSAKEKSELAMKAMNAQNKEMIDAARREGKLATDVLNKRQVKEALEEIKNVAEGLFKKDERGDLLDDIDTALGSPVKKKLADIKAKMTGCKETKVHEALDLMEEIINEVSVKRWKEAAKNSVEGRKDKRRKNEDDYYEFTGKLPGSLQTHLDIEHAKRDNYHSDRVNRAKYLAKNLPDSNKSASKLKSAADKVVKDRENKGDEQSKKKGEAGEKYIKGKDNASFDKLVKQVGNDNVAYSRERHAQTLSGKPATGEDGKRKVGNYDGNEDSPQQKRKNVENNLNNAEKRYNKARSVSIDDKVKGVYDSKHEDEYDSAASNLSQAKHDKKQFTRDYK